MSRTRTLATLLTGLAILLVGRPVAAQTSQPAAVADSPDLLLAGSEEMLWIARIQDGRTRLFARSKTDPFDLGRPYAGRIVRVTTLGDELFVFDNNGQPYSFLADSLDPVPRHILPGDTIPSAIFGTADEVVALVPESVAGSLSTTDEAAPAGRTIDDEDAPPAVVVYNLRDWKRLDACPPATRGARQIAVGVAQERVIVAWLTDDGTLRTAWRPARGGGRWSEPYTFPGGSWRRFFLVSADNLLTLLAIPERGEGPQAWRLLGSLRTDGNEAWHKGVVNWSALPDGASEPVYTMATGFNQHVAVLAASVDGTQLRFARIDAAPAEETLDVQQILSEPAAQYMAERLFVSITLMLLLLVLIGLFAFRRESMVQPVAIPPGYALAPVSLRLLAWLIDFLPFSIAAGVMLEIPFSLAMRTLFAWGFSPEQNEIATNQTLLLWWGLSIGGHTAYALVMELITGRTVGKVLLGLRVLAERGTPPTLIQMLVRNLMRLLELIPHFWVFGLLVILSRNHQRLGDVFARTYVARKAALLIMVDDEHERDNAGNDQQTDTHHAPGEDDPTHEDKPG